MAELCLEQVRAFRLHSHHLDAPYGAADIPGIVGACGMQNSPPGAWETALFNRVPDCGLSEMDRLLCRERSLLQAWSIRGAPVVFPAGESGVFLRALCPEGDEPWIYTDGIRLALDFLQMGFGEIFELLVQVIPGLDGTTVAGKAALDQTLADWMLPLLPAEKRALWTRPSMYGSPDRQTVGGAVVSFLLRPCALCGLVVFGERRGAGPTFTSYRSWTGRPLAARPDAGRELVRKFLRCYGPTTADALAAWLGCSGRQARRLWSAVSDELEPVTLSGRRAYLLSADRERLLSPAPLERELLLLGGHDPFLDQRDRAVLLPDGPLQKRVWRLVGNPGAVLYRGEIIGIWTGRKKGGGLEVRMTLWGKGWERRRLLDLAEGYAAFRGLKLLEARIED